MREYRCSCIILLAWLLHASTYELDDLSCDAGIYMQDIVRTYVNICEILDE